MTSSGLRILAPSLPATPPSCSGSGRLEVLRDSSPVSRPVMENMRDSSPGSTVSRSGSSSGGLENMRDD